MRSLSILVLFTGLGVMGYKLMHTSFHWRTSILRCSHPTGTIPENTNKTITPTNSNINLFAADDRKPKIAPTTTATASLIPNITSSPVTVASALRSSNSLIELQAERLRLEANRDQILIDSQRIEKEKLLLSQIDELLLEVIAVDKKLTSTTENMEFLKKLVSENRPLMRKELFLRLLELMNYCDNMEERDRLQQLYDRLQDNLKDLDMLLWSEVEAGIQKDLSAENNKVKSNTDKLMKEMENVGVYDQMLQQWVQQTVNNNSDNNFNNINNNNSLSSFIPPISMTNINATMVRFPSALPLNLLPLLLRSPEILRSDFEFLQQQVFPEYQVSDYSTYLATFRRGSTKNNSFLSVEAVLEEANRRLAADPSGAGDRIRLFALPEYRRPGSIDMNSSTSFLEKYSGEQFEVVFTALSKSAMPAIPGNLEKVLTVLLFLGGVSTSFLYSVDLNAQNPLFVSKALQMDETVLDSVLPISLGLLLLQIMHDSAHVLVAKTNGMKLSLPQWLPSLQIGLFGSVTNLLSFPKTRKQLFDVSIAGPVVGFLASLLTLETGLSLTEAAQMSPDVVSSFPQVPMGFFQLSLLLHQLVDQTLHLSDLALSSPASTLVSIHPLVAVGMVGLFSNALNFLPIGRLDGGRVCMSIAGRQSARSISLITLLGQVAGFLTSSANPIAIFWIITVVFLQRGLDLPPEDDVTPIATDQDDKTLSIPYIVRAASLAFCVFMAAGILLPIPIESVTTATSAVTSGNFLQNMSPPPSI